MISLARKSRLIRRRTALIPIIPVDPYEAYGNPFALYAPDAGGSLSLTLEDVANGNNGTFSSTNHFLANVNESRSFRLQPSITDEVTLPAGFLSGFDAELCTILGWVILPYQFNPPASSMSIFSVNLTGAGKSVYLNNSRELVAGHSGQSGLIIPTASLDFYEYALIGITFDRLASSYKLYCVSKSGTQVVSGNHSNIATSAISSAYIGRGFSGGKLDSDYGAFMFDNVALPQVDIETLYTAEYTPQTVTHSQSITNDEWEVDTGCSNQDIIVNVDILPSNPNYIEINPRYVDADNNLAVYIYHNRDIALIERSGGVSTLIQAQTNVVYAGNDVRVIADPNNNINVFYGGNAVLSANVSSGNTETKIHVASSDGDVTAQHYNLFGAD